MSHSGTTPRTFTADRLSAALHEVGDAARPDYLPDIVAQASRTRQRPALTFLERWLPMDIAVRRQGVPRAVLVFGVLALLLALLVATVAFVGTRPSRPALVAASNGLLAFVSGSDILVTEPDGSGRRTLVSGGGEGLAFSPDGGRLAYWAPDSTGRFEDLMVVDADGSNPVTVASGVPDVTSIEPAWSPDGTTIAYSARTTQPDASACPGVGIQNGDFCTSRIFLAPVDGSGPRQVGDPELDARSPDWSPDGKTIAFGGGNASPTVGVHLYLMDADGTNVRQLSDVIGTDWAFIRVDWSHDGTKIAAHASHDAIKLLDWDIWIIPADGSEPTNVGTRDDVDEVMPEWAPDRDALTWWAGAMILMEEGADPVELGPQQTFTWSPDGTLLLTSTDNAVSVVDLQGREQLNIEGPAGPVAWQPVFD